MFGRSEVISPLSPSYWMTKWRRLHDFFRVWEFGTAFTIGWSLVTFARHWLSPFFILFFTYGRAIQVCIIFRFIIFILGLFIRFF